MPRILLNPYRNNLSIEGLTERHDEMLNQPVRTTSDVTFSSLVANGDVSITGNLTVSGDVDFTGKTSLINTDAIIIKDEVIDVNGDNVNPIRQGGIRVNRGPGLDPFYMIYDEGTQSFRIGQEGDLQAVTTRSDNLIDGQLIIWNGTQNQLSSTDSLSIPLTFTESAVFQKPLMLANGAMRSIVFTDPAGNLVLDANSAKWIRLGASSTSGIFISQNVPLMFGNSVSLTGSTQGIDVSAAKVNLPSNAMINWGSNAMIVSENDGDDLNLRGSTVHVSPSDRLILDAGIPMFFGDTAHIMSGTNGTLNINNAGDILIDTTGSGSVRIPVLTLGYSASASQLVTDTSGNLSIDAIGNIILNASEDILINDDHALVFGDKRIQTTVDALELASPGDIYLNAGQYVRIPGLAAFKLGDGTILQEDIQNNTNFTSMGDLQLSPGTGRSIIVAAASPLQFGAAEKISSDGDNLRIESSNVITLAAVTSVDIPQARYLSFGDLDHTITQNISNELKINSSHTLVLSSPEAVAIDSPKLLIGSHQFFEDNTSKSLHVSGGNGIDLDSTVRFNDTLSASIDSNGIMYASVLFNGGVGISDNLMVRDILNVRKFTSVDSNVLLSDINGEVPIQVKNPAMVDGRCISLQIQGDDVTGYTIGRGQGRSLLFTVPTLLEYRLVGNDAQFQFGNTAGDIFMTVNPQGTQINQGDFTIVAGNLDLVNGGGTFSTLTLSNTLDVQNSLHVDAFQFTLDTSAILRNGLFVTDGISDSTFWFSVSSMNVLCNLPLDITGPVTMAQSLQLSGDIYVLGEAYFSQSMDVAGNLIHNVGLPMVDSDAATKAYVDQVAAGMTIKESVAAATTAAIDLNAPIYLLDGVSLNPGNRILVKDNDPFVDGIYVLDANSIPQRSTDMEPGDDAAGNLVFIANGINNGGSGYIVIGKDIIVGASAVRWTAFTGASQITAGPGLYKTGNTLSVSVDQGSINLNDSGQLRITPSFFGQGLVGGSSTGTVSTSTNQSHVTKIGTITTGVWNATTIAVSYGGTGVTAVSPYRILFGNDVNAQALSFNDKFVFRNGNLGIGLTAPSTNLHVLNSSSGAWMTLEDANAATPQSVGTVLKQTFRKSRLYMNGTGTLYLSQDDVTSESSIVLATQQLSRLYIDAFGNVCIATQNPVAGSKLTVNGNISSVNINVSGNVVTPAVTLRTNPATGSGLYLDSTSLTLPVGFDSQISSRIADFYFDSQANVNNIVSQNRVTNAGKALNICISSSFIAASFFQQGLHIPQVLQIGGSYDTPSSGFRLQLSNNALQVIPGSSAMTTNIMSPVVLTKTLYFNDVTGGTATQVTMQLSGNDFTFAPTPGPLPLNFFTGLNAPQDVIVKLATRDGSGYVTFDPTVGTGGTFSISPQTPTHLRGPVYFYGPLNDAVGNASEGSLGNNGWYYLGQLNIGRTSLVVSNHFSLTIDYDGMTPYRATFYVTRRNVCSFVMYSAGGVYYMFLRIISAPCRLKVFESPSPLSFTSFEGSGSSPSGAYSAYNGNTWNRDYDTSVAQPTAPLEIGSLSVIGTTSLSNLTVSNGLNVTGSFSVSGNTAFYGNNFDWTATSGIKAFNLNTDLQQNSTLTVSAPNTSNASLVLSKPSGTATFMFDALDGSLNLSHDVNDTSSRLHLKTRGLSRVVIDDLGAVIIKNTQDSSSTTDATCALQVAGGIACSKSLSATNVVTDRLKLRSSSTSAYITCQSDGSLSFENTRLSNVATPVLDTDVVIKSYVDMAIQGLSTKDSVKASSVGASVDLTQPLTILDGVSLLEGDRVLLKDQSNGVENGIYVVHVGYSPTRSDDLDTGMHAASSHVFVNLGDVNQNSGWVCNSPMGSDTVDVNWLSWAQFSGAGQITVGPGLRKYGNRLDVNLDNTSIEIYNDIIRLSSGALGVGLSGGSGQPVAVSSITHLSALGTIQIGTWNASVIDMQYGGTGSAGFSVGSIPFSNGASLTEGMLYFDQLNVRLGINTANPTAGLSLTDRDMHFMQTATLPSSIMMSSTITNYSYAMRHDNNSLIWSSGAGMTQMALTDIMTLDSSGNLTVGQLVKAKATVVGSQSVKITGNTFEKLTPGSFNISMFNQDNSGNWLTMYGSMGTVNNTTNSEFLRLGYFNGEYILSTSATGTGVSRDLCIQTGLNTNQMVLTNLGAIQMNGPVTISHTGDSTSGTLGSVGMPIESATFATNFSTVAEAQNQPIVGCRVSSNGQVIVLIGEAGCSTPLVISKDFGQTFMVKQMADLNLPFNETAFSECAMSSTGQYILLCVIEGPLLFSNDYGDTWSLRLQNVDRFWDWCSVSADGQNMLASTISDGVFRSYDYGQSFQGVTDLPTDQINLSFVQIDQSDSINQYAGYEGGPLMVSRDLGASFNPNLNIRNGLWWDLYFSKSSYLLLLENPGSLFVSADSGSTWEEKMSDTARQWVDGGVSATGNVMAAVAYMGLIHVSLDYGNTWTNVIDSNPRLWNTCIVTDVGYIFAAGRMTPIFTSIDGTHFDSSATVYNTMVGGASDTGSTLVFAEYIGNVYKAMPSSDALLGYLNQLQVANAAAITVLGDGSLSGTLTSNKLHISANTDDAVYVEGSVSANTIMFRGPQVYRMKASSSGFFDVTGTLSATTSAVQLFSNDGTNSVDVCLRAYGAGTTYSSTSEWLQMGFEAASTRYAIRTMQGGSATARPLTLGVGNTDSLTLNTDGSLQFGGNASFSGGVTITNTLDAQTSFNGGAFTVLGGMAVSKTLIVGGQATIPIIHATDHLEMSAGGSTDRLMLNYTSRGKLNVYNDATATFNIHVANSEGPQSTNQEKLVIGYNDTTSVVIASTATGAGVPHDLVIKTGRNGENANQLRLMASDGSINAYGVLRCVNTAESLSSDTGSVVVAGGLGVHKNLHVSGGGSFGSGGIGPLLQLNGQNPWNMTSTQNGIVVTSVLDTSVFQFMSSAGSTLLSMESSSLGSLVNTSASIQVASTSAKALAIRDGNGLDVFLVDTVDHVVDVANCRIINLTSPMADTDAANKSYVDLKARGLQVKGSVAVSSPLGINVDLTNPLTQLDGRPVAVGDRVLLQDQTNSIENGIYVVVAGGYLTRAADMPIGSRASGSFVFVQTGVTRGQTGFACSADATADVVGRDPITFSMFSSSMVATGNGLTKDTTGTLTVQLDTLGSGLSFNGGKLRVDPSIAGTGLTYTAGVISVNPVSAVGTVSTGIWRATAIELPYGGTGNSSFPTGGLVFSTGAILTSDSSTLFWNNTIKSLGIGTANPDPNLGGDGLTVSGKDICIQGTTASMVWADASANYQYKMTRTDNALVMSAGNSTNKTGLVDFLCYRTNGQVGIGYTSLTVGNMAATLDVNGTMRVTGAVTLTQSLTVTSGGTGVSTLAYGLVIANGTAPFTTTGTLPNGGIPIGMPNGTIAVESGATLRAHIGLAIGVNVQAWATNLDAISALTTTAGNFIVANGTNFTTMSYGSARTAMGLGSLSVLNTINNSNWSGTQLSVANGGTGNTTFTTATIPFYDGTMLSSSNLYYDSTSAGICVNGTAVTAGNGFQTVAKDISVMTSANTAAVSYLFQAQDASFSWRIRRQDDGSGTGTSNLIFSGGGSSFNKGTLIDRLTMRSSGDIFVASNTAATAASIGAFIVTGGISAGNGLYVAGTATFAGGVILNTTLGITGAITATSVTASGVVNVTNTSVSNGYGSGAFTVAGGAGIGGALNVKGRIVLNRDSQVGSRAGGLTVAMDSSTAWAANTDITDVNRTVSLVNNVAGGMTAISLRNLTSTRMWDIISEGGTSNMLVFQSLNQTDNTAKTWMTMSAVDGSVSILSALDSVTGTLTSGALALPNGGMTVGRSLQVGGTIVLKNTVAAEVTAVIANGSNATGAFASLRIQNDSGNGGSLFLNSSTRVSDGAANVMTLRNDVGDLRLLSSGGNGLQISATTGNVTGLGLLTVTSGADSNGATDATASVSTAGGASVAKNMYVGGNLVVSGSVSIPSMVQDASGSVTTPFIDTVNVTTVTVRSAMLTTINGLRTLAINFVVMPNVGSTRTLFTFTLPNLSANLADRLSITAAASGYTDDINVVVLQNMICTGVTGTTKAMCTFQAVNATAHYVQIIVHY